MVPLQEIIGLVLVGVASGLISGLFGLGGGILSVPMVLFLTGSDIRAAAAASLVSIVLSAPMGAWTHHKSGRDVRWAAGARLGILGLIGVGIATWADRWISESALTLLFAAFLVYSAAHLNRPPPASPRKPHPGILSLTAILAGVVAKLLGVGGGLILVPAMIVGGIPVHAAVGTSLVAVMVNAATSTAANLLFFPFMRPWLVWGVALAGGSILGSWAGALTARRTSASGLKRLLSFVLVLVALSLLYRAA